jgi:hypothetical protein
MEEDNGLMRYVPDAIEVKRGEQIKFILKNAGDRNDDRVDGVVEVPPPLRK